MKRFFAAAVCFAVLLASCDLFRNDDAPENVPRTTLTIRNESSHELTHVIWNNAFFTASTDSLRPGRA